MLGLAIGGALLSFLSDDAGYVAIVPGMIVLGAATGLFHPSTTAGVTAVKAACQSLAGGVVYMFQIAGGAVGLGLSTTIFIATSNSTIEDRVRDAGVQLSGGRRPAPGPAVGHGPPREVAARFPTVADRLTEFANDAFIAGFNVVFRLDTALRSPS